MLASTYILLLKHPCVLHRWLTAGQRLCQYQQQEHPFGDRGEKMSMLVLRCSLSFPAHWPEEQLNHKQPLARVAQTTAHTLFSPEMPRISLESLTHTGAASLCTRSGIYKEAFLCLQQQMPDVELAWSFMLGLHLSNKEKQSHSYGAVTK